MTTSHQNLMIAESVVDELSEKGWPGWLNWRELSDVVLTMLRPITDKREHECYDCHKLITREQALEGWILIDYADRLSKGEFEGWVHCVADGDSWYWHGDDCPIEGSGAIIVCPGCVLKCYRDQQGKPLFS